MRAPDTNQRKARAASQVSRGSSRCLLLSRTRLCPMLCPRRPIGGPTPPPARQHARKKCLPCCCLSKGPGFGRRSSKPRVGGSNPSRRANIPTRIASSPAMVVRRATLTRASAEGSEALRKISPPLQSSSEGSARPPVVLAFLLPGLRADVTLEPIRCRHSQEQRFPVLSAQKELMQ